MPDLDVMSYDMKVATPTGIPGSVMEIGSSPIIRKTTTTTKKNLNFNYLVAARSGLQIF